MSQQDLVGTFIMFGKNGTQANKTIKQNSDSFDAFDSPGYNHVMDVRYDTSAPEMNGKQLEALIHHFRNNTYTFSRNWDIISNLRRLFAENVKKNLATLQHLHTNVGHVKLFPGYKYTNLDQYIDEKCE